MLFYSIPKPQATFQFINNTANINGAAVYATDLIRCSYTPSINKANALTITETSIFELDHIFYFRYMITIT